MIHVLIAILKSLMHIWVIFTVTLLRVSKAKTLKVVYLILGRDNPSKITSFLLSFIQYILLHIVLTSQTTLLLTVTLKTFILTNFTEVCIR